MSAGEVTQRSHRIFEKFLAHAELVLPREYHSIALYFPIRGEVDTREFLAYFKKHAKKILFPCTDKASMEIEFRAAADFSELRTGSYGIAEPSQISVKVSPDVVLVPGVVFAKDLHRMGYGAGYYDRYAASLEKADCRKKTRLVGLAYDFQVVDSLPTESHDHPMDSVISENEVYS